MSGDFDGCYRSCRVRKEHTLQWGGCEHAERPEPTVSVSRVYQDTDGLPSIGFDVYTEAQLADLIEPVLREVPNGATFAEIASAAARAILHRHDKNGHR